MNDDITNKHYHIQKAIILSYLSSINYLQFFSLQVSFRTFFQVKKHIRALRTYITTIKSLISFFFLKNSSKDCNMSALYNYLYFLFLIFFNDLIYINVWRNNFHFLFLLKPVLNINLFKFTFLISAFWPMVSTLCRLLHKENCWRYSAQLKRLMVIYTCENIKRLLF